MKKTTKLYIVLCSIIAVGIVLDMLTKHFATDVYSNFIEGFISFQYIINTGAGWSILSNHTIFLTIFTGILIAGLIFVIIKFKPKSWLYTISLALIISGAIGNFIDRIILGGVRDFICLDFIKFPIFNLADTFLTIGAILICVWILFFTKKEHSQNNQQKDKNNE